MIQIIDQFGDFIGRYTLIMDEKAYNSGDSAYYYFTNFGLFNANEEDLLCNYKYFLEHMIMKLGEDWRIESSLLAQEIVSIRSNYEPKRDMADFNIFNEFLSAFLKNKIGKEFQYTNYSEQQIQESFLETVVADYPEEKIHASLTFKTLSLGYCITATEVWNKTFKNPIENGAKKLNSLKIFGKLLSTTIESQEFKQDMKSSFEASTIRRKLQKIDIASERFSCSEADMQSEKKEVKETSLNKWEEFQAEEFSEMETKQIKLTLDRIKHTLGKSQILSHFICYVDEMHMKDGRKVRIFSLANEFYLNAFVIWLIFSIKMFFSLSFNDYLRFCKDLLSKFWKEEYERPLKKFQLILEREWNKLLKDYTVALHDDLEVLHILIDRVRKEVQTQWESRISSLKQSFPHQI